MATIGRALTRVLIGILVGPTVGSVVGAVVGLVISGEHWLKGLLMGAGIGIYLGILTGAILGAIAPIVCHGLRCAGAGTIVGLAAGYALWSTSLDPRWAITCAVVGCCAGAATTLFGRMAGKVPTKPSAEAPG